MIVHAAGNLHNNNTSNSTQNNNAGQNAFMSFADGSSNNGGAQMQQQQQQQQPQQPNGNGQMPFGMYPHPQYVTVQQGQPNMLMQNNPNNGGYGFPPNGYFYVPQFGSSMGFQQMDNGMFQMMPPMMQQQQQQPQQPQQSAASTPPPMQTNSINSNSNNKNGTDNSNNVINNNSGSSSSNNNNNNNNNNNSSSMNNTMMNNTNMPSSIATSAMPSSSDATKNPNLSGNQPQLQFLQQPYSSTLKSSTPAPSTSHQDQNNNNTTNNTTPTPSANGTSTTSKSPSSIPPVVMMAPQGMTVAGVLFVPGPNSPPSTQPQFVPVAPDQTGAPGVVVQGSMPSFPGAINAAISFMNNKPPSSIMESVQSSYFPSSSINSDDSDSNGSASSGSGTSGLSRPKNRNSGGSGVYPSSSSNSGGAQQQQQQQQQNNEPNTGRNNSNKSQMTAHATPGNHQPQQQQQALPSTFTPHVNAFLQQMGKDFTRPFNGSQPASQSQASQTSQTSHQPQAQQQQQQQQQQQPGPQHMLQQPHAMHPHAFIPAGHMHQPGMPQGMPTQFMPIFDRSSPNGQPILMGHQIAPMGMFSMEDFYDLNKRRFNTSSSKYRGVSWHRRDRKWLARTWINGRIEHLGCFRSEEMAALAVDLRTIEHFGESRKELNFPDPEERKRLKEIFTKTGEFRLRSAEDLAQKGGSHNSGVSGQGSNDGGASTQGSKETSETDTPPSEVGNINSAGHSSKHHSKRDSNNSRSSNDNSSSDSERKSDDLVSDSVGPKISSFARDKSISSRSSDSSSNGSSSDKRSDEFFSKSSDRSSSKRSVPSSATASSISLPINKRRKSDKAGHSSSASVMGSSKSAMA